MSRGFRFNLIIVLVAVGVVLFISNREADSDSLKEAANQTVKMLDMDEDGREETVVYSVAGKTIYTKTDKDGDGRYEAVTKYKNGKKHLAEFDYNGDGRTQTWVYFDVNEKVRRRARDKNLDGKPDRWYYLMETREQERGQIREYDKNFDGKVDKREMTLFQYRKTTKSHDHLWQWKEEDRDFDGVIDVYRVRGEKNPKPDKKGTKIDTNFTEIESSIVASDASQTVKMIKQVEERERMIRRSQEGLKYD